LEPYLSGVYIRSAETKIPVISVNVPIKTRLPGKTAGHSTASEEKSARHLTIPGQKGYFNDWIKKLI